ncbi:hypothetical protein C8J57DRAFT_1527894 [Mycena rebaudengoi]|nr:hypothetical protein C8J57DRAFT_1527894 [Mycena rebaudengoi]
MAELAALLTRLPDTVLEQFCDAACPLTFYSMQADVPQSFTANFRTKNAQLFSDTAWVDLDDLQAWLRQRGDLDHLLDPTISERNFPPVGLDPRSLYGMDGTFGDATFDLYPAVTFDQPGPSTEFEYLRASGLSTLSSGLDFFDDNASEPNLDWGPSLAAFFDSVETSALESLLSLSDDPTYTRFRPPYVTDQPKYAGVPQRQRSVLHLRAQRNIPEPSSGTFADVPTTRITGSADRPAHHLRTAPNLPAHLRCAASRTGAPHLANALSTHRPASLR